MKPIITELDDDDDEWEIVAGHEDEQSVMDDLIQAIDHTEPEAEEHAEAEPFRETSWGHWLGERHGEGHRAAP